MVSRHHKTSILIDDRSWWIVFKEAENQNVKRLTRKGFGHVFVITRMNNLSLAIEPLMGTVNHILTDAPIAEILAEQKIAGHTVIHFRHKASPKVFKIRTPMITCASYLAYTIGISFFGITPYQLYKKLIKIGGEEI